MADLPELPPPMVPAQRRTGVDGRLLPEALSHEQKMTAWFRKLAASIAAWQAPRGAVVKCGAGAYASGATVSFGYTFSSPPRVVVTPFDLAETDIFGVSGITVSSFVLSHSHATAWGFNWIAVQE
jgi:hypothetical protein